MFRLGEFLHWPLNSAAHVLSMPSKDRLNDTFLADAATYAHLRVLDPGLPDHVWEVIVRYRPLLSTLQWNAVREFTIITAVRMQPRTFETVRRLMTMSARFNVWVWAATGTELTIERVYTHNNVYLFLQERLAKHSEIHRWGVVRQLGAITDALGTASIKRLPSPKRNPRRRPFTLAEVGALHSWAASLTTNLKRQNALAILGLAGGAGLRSDEVIETRIRDIEIIEGRVFVHVPGIRARTVPVRTPWNRTLLRSLDGRTETDEFVFRGWRLDEYRPRAIQTFLTEHPSRIRATVSRLRASWVITQIDNGLPLPVLMKIAGFTATASLDKHLVHAQPLDLGLYTGLIIGEEISR